jgi:hypothetical protein
MKVLFALLVVLSLVPGSACRAAEPAKAAIKYFVQVVRGTDDKTPPETGAKLIGAKLQKQLQPMFRWPHYWEVQQKPITVEEGKTARTDLKSGHVLEIDLREQEKRTVRLFRGGKVVRTQVCSRGQEFMIQGTEPGDGKVWFFVVRTDPPSI